VIWPIEEKSLQAVSDEPARLGAAKWIWFKEGNPAAAAPPEKRYFRRVLALEGVAEIQSARMVMTADNEFELWVNGRRAGGGDDFTHTYTMDCTRLLVPGTNLLAVLGVNAADFPNPAGLVGNLVIKYRDGRTVQVPTDGQWEAAMTAQGDWRTELAAPVAWQPAMELGAVGMEPWGNVDHEAGPSKLLYPSVDAIAGLMRKLGVPPDFDYQTQSGEHSLRYIHKRIGKTDLFFVANEKPHPEQAVCSFRVQAKRPELWRPDTGRMEQAAIYDEVDGCVRMPVRLDASGSVFVMFRSGEGIERDRITAVKRNGELLVDVSKKELTAPAGGEPGIETIRRVGSAVEAQVQQPGTYTLTSAKGKSRRVTASILPEPVEIRGPWELQFPPSAGAPERVTLDHLVSWSQHSDAGVRYFSGTATYRKTFDLPEALRGSGQHLTLDLGDVKNLAEVRLNGKDLGVFWAVPFRVDVTDAIKATGNSLEIEVVNFWPNRIIGDQSLPPEKRLTRTNIRKLTKNTLLMESGLLGPVSVLAEKR
jgi:hypothetical protein